MENKQLNSVESIEVIQKMIAATREKFERGAGRSFLVWGYTCAIVTVAVLLAHAITGNANVYFGWWAIPVVGYILQTIMIAKPAQKPVRTYLDTFISTIWAVLGVTLILVPFGAIFSFHNGALIMPVEGIILSSGVVMMGMTLKVRSVAVGGIIAGLLSFTMFFCLQYAPYLFLLMFILAMIIPGHILNRKAQQCSKN